MDAEGAGGRESPPRRGSLVRGLVGGMLVNAVSFAFGVWQLAEASGGILLPAIPFLTLAGIAAAAVFCHVVGRDRTAEGLWIAWMLGFGTGFAAWYCGASLLG